MSTFVIAITYIVSWWLCFLMVLPLRAEPDVNPLKGNAVSAPAQPHLRYKARLAALLAILPTALAYFLDYYFIER